MSHHEYPLFDALWGCVTRTLDRDDTDASTNELKALESEMAGHVLTYRLTRGWLVRSSSAPSEPPSLDLGTVIGLQTWADMNAKPTKKIQ
jgi:hypothetical protein